MGSQTAHGFPYPVGTDRVMDGDNAMQALAQYTDDVLWGVAAQKFPRCRMEFPGAGQSLPHNVTTVLDFAGGTVAYDTDGMADIANDRINIKHAGFYTMTVRMVYQSNATGFRGTLIYRGATPCLDDYRMAINGTVTALMVTSDPVLCAVNDQIQIKSFQQSGAALVAAMTANSYPSFLTVAWWPGQ